MAKGVTTKVTPFENFYCLMNNARTGAVFLAGKRFQFVRLLQLY